MVLLQVLKGRTLLCLLYGSQLVSLVYSHYSGGCIGCTEENCIDHGVGIDPRFECKVLETTMSVLTTDHLPSDNHTSIYLSRQMFWGILAIVALTLITSMVTLVSVACLVIKVREWRKLCVKTHELLEIIHQDMRSISTDLQGQGRSSQSQEYRKLGGQEERESMLSHLQTAQIQSTNKPGLHYSHPTTGEMV